MHFKPHELKNGERGKDLREYHLKLPEDVNGWVKWWHGLLSRLIGPDFERTCPWVFPSRAVLLDDQGRVVWKKCLERGFYDGVRGTCLEVRGHSYRTHLIRHHVATFVFNGRDATIADMQQAATLLGDRLETVVKKYNKPQEQALLDKGYFSHYKGKRDAAD